MSRSLFNAVKFFAALAVLSFSFSVNAAECPRGTLDKQYCDRDGNLTADYLLNRRRV